MDHYLLNNINKTTDKSDKSTVIIIPDLHAIPLIENEDVSENHVRNREILMRNMNSKAKTKSIGLIQNGNKSKFKSIILDDGSYVLSNTCAFDSVIQILAVAYCDSVEYKSYVDEKKNVNELWHLVSTVLRDGLTVQTYRKRAKILKQFYPVEPMFNGVGYLSVEQAVDNLLIKLLGDDESVEIVRRCSSCGYEHKEKNQCITVCVQEKYLTNRLLDNLLTTEINHLYDTTNCKSCSRDMIANPQFGKHIFFNMINLNNTIDSPFTVMSLRLNHIPKHLNISELSYYLRGSVTTPDNQQEITSHTLIGHYHAHTYRNPMNIWQLYDDIKDKVHTLHENSQVNVQFIMYSK